MKIIRRGNCALLKLLIDLILMSVQMGNCKIMMLGFSCH